jgi:copper homeostasis protein
MSSPHSSGRLVIEIVVDSVESALAAQAGGADRVELCANLLEGGTTPSAGMIAQVRDQISIGLHVIIRPRGGDFCYTEQEFAVMLEEIIWARTLGVDGVVFGILTPEGDVDVARTRELIQLARPMSVTFHRAFDMARDPFRALDDLIGLDVDRLLTSGQAPSALEGLDLIAELIRRAAGRLSVMPGGGVARHIREIVERSGAREVHFSATTSVESAMRYRNPRVAMGVPGRAEYTRTVTDAELVRTLRREAER